MKLIRSLAKSENPSITREVSGEGVQQPCSRFWKGQCANVPPQGGRKHPQPEYIEVNSKDILFICRWCVEGIDKTVEKRIRKEGRLGSARIEIAPGVWDRELYAQSSPTDLLHYGLIPELIGQVFQSLATFPDLDEAAL